jgi:hypothetical protein
MELKNHLNKDLSAMKHHLLFILTITGLLALCLAVPTALANLHRTK